MGRGGKPESLEEVPGQQNSMRRRKERAVKAALKTAPEKEKMF